jgi:hypothetical protein
MVGLSQMGFGDSLLNVICSHKNGILAAWSYRLILDRSYLIINENWHLLGNFETLFFSFSVVTDRDTPRELLIKIFEGFFIGALNNLIRMKG